ncbi:hypothetical protein [Massilia endophytica]|uniref:hypothetical protein n=1 Tax=Massilia endophytica TaxID=2899220 RepID=UPI001E654A92|nr:hypothetical protein [Massilia endophytica]UGQ45928.1 hypothetical protein LSQ66_19390 [Massilia endophytica]
MISRLFLLAALFCTGAAQAQQYQVYRFWSPSVDVLLNEQRQAAGGIWVGGQQWGVRLDADGTKTKFAIPGFFGEVNGFNESGTALITYFGNTQGLGLWYQDGRRTLIPLPASTIITNSGRSLNDSNVVVGGMHTGFGGNAVVRGFRWQDGVMNMLDSGGFARSGASDINNAGEIVGWADNGEGEQGVIWRNGVLQVLNSPSVASRALFVNDQGMVGGYSIDSQGGLHAVVWENGQMIDLGHGWLRAINNNGAAIWSGDRHYLWQDGRSIDLATLIDEQKYLGYQLDDLYDINDQGQISASLRDPLTNDYFGVLLSPFEVTPVPEPHQFMLMLAGLLLLPRRQKRQSPGGQEGQQVPAENQ